MTNAKNAALTKVLFLDLNGTVRSPKSGGLFIKDPLDQELIPGAKEAIATHQGLIVGITNQGGVEAGYKSLEDCIKEQRRTLEIIPEMESIYFCPDFEGRFCWEINGYYHREKQVRSFAREESTAGFDCAAIFANPGEERLNFRKPSPGMIEYAYSSLATERGGRYNLAPLENCLMVGDRLEDKQAAQSLGMPFMEAEKWRERGL
ncbi:MAG: HAD hydrolase-like protein [Oscillatoria sp. SIO1A7]|nr:HAD hydrolase-like protein [Oscillatoria sp. SIO1A7]